MTILSSSTFCTHSIGSSLKWLSFQLVCYQIYNCILCKYCACHFVWILEESPGMDGRVPHLTAGASRLLSLCLRLHWHWEYCWCILSSFWKSHGNGSHGDYDHGDSCHGSCWTVRTCCSIASRTRVIVLVDSCLLHIVTLPPCFYNLCCCLLQ